MCEASGELTALSCWMLRSLLATSAWSCFLDFSTSLSFCLRSFSSSLMVEIFRRDRSHGVNNEDLTTQTCPICQHAGE